ncbi:MAG: hypothetical protein RR301_11635 [Clostridia bacterium]
MNDPAELRIGSPIHVASRGDAVYYIASASFTFAEHTCYMIKDQKGRAAGTAAKQNISIAKGDPNNEKRGKQKHIGRH